VLHVGLQVDASRSTAGFAGAGYIELVDPCGHAIDGHRGELGADWHGFAAIGAAAKLGDQVRAGGVARNDAGFATTKCRLTAKELELEANSFEVETACAVAGAVTTTIDAARLEDLCDDVL